MFKFLKEKLKNWTGKIKEEKEKEPKQIVETPKTKAPKKKVKAVKKTKEKVKTSKKEEIKELQIPEKFIPGTGKYEPDTEKIEKIAEKIEKTAEQKPDIEASKEKKGFFSKLKESLHSTKITEEEFNKYSEELEMLLLENNVALEVVDIIINNLKEEIVGEEIKKKELEEKINSSITSSIKKILLDPFDPLEKIASKKEKPYVILFCGINGSGKTTTLAKFAHKLKGKKISSVMAAADTFRAAAVEQLKKHGEILKIPVISQEYGSDPAAVGFDAIQYAKKNKIEVVLIDTAGRMHTDKNLMREIEKITRICKPDLKIFIGESIAGNDSTEQAKAFNEIVNIDAIVLTKADIDEKGGTALSVGQVTGKPIIYLGEGQEYSKLKKFEKNDFIKNLGL
jgi:fused signal recognition particle receptor